MVMVTVTIAAQLLKGIRMGSLQLTMAVIKLKINCVRLSDHPERITCKFVMFSFLPKKSSSPLYHGILFPKRTWWWLATFVSYTTMQLCHLHIPRGGIVLVTQLCLSSYRWQPCVMNEVHPSSAGNKTSFSLSIHYGTWRIVHHIFVSL